ncbi:MAG TPA: hypothetical protein VE684_17330 [Crenalkalicoccus sp.]|jgi:hypothetical protein|nr:hypothetical protein [Crenalkalicoccus sp.]
MRIGSRILLGAGGALLLAPLAFGQAQPGGDRPGTAVAYTTDAVATVEAVDQQSRQVTLRGAGGRVFTVQAGPAIENLNRVKPGDRVMVRYVEALAATLAKPGQGGGSVTEQTGIARQTGPTGGPVGTVGSQVRATVTVDAIDHATHSVSFTGPANVARTVMVRDPDAQRFVDTLKPGDQVELVYTESLAIALEPAPK